MFKKLKKTFKKLITIILIISFIIPNFVFALENQEFKEVKSETINGIIKDSKFEENLVSFFNETDDIFLRLFFKVSDGFYIIDYFGSEEELGNITQIVNSGTQLPFTKTYTYDNLNRLTQAVDGTNTDTYTYSDTGNILTHNGNSYSYTNTQHPQAVTSYNGVSYVYNTNGNLQSDSTGKTYTYDSLQRLKKIENNSSAIAYYEYDDERQRIAKITDGDTKKYLNNTTERLHDNSYQNFIFSENSRVGSKINGVLTYNHADHLQSSSLQTDTFGNSVFASSFKPFGEVENTTGTRQHDYTYTDQESDSESSLMYYNSRYYNPELKRFTSPDPASTFSPIDFIQNPQELNAYSYVANNPIVYSDPSGNFAVLAAAALAWAVFEVASTIYDMYDTAQTLAGQNATTSDKVISVTGLAVGAIAPGGGYGTAGKTTAKVAKESGFIAKTVKTVSETVETVVSKVKGVFKRGENKKLYNKYRKNRPSYKKGQVGKV
jgi:RHS repeat-associated protein